MLLDRLTRYSPSEDDRKTLELTGEFTITGDREQRIMEINATFSKVQDKEDLYRIEEAIAIAYDMKLVRLLPHYAKELYTDEYIHQVVLEAHRIGAVTRGFLDNYIARKEGDTLVIEIGFVKSGVNLVCQAGTPELLSNIIKAEFGIDVPVRIVGSSTPDVLYDQFQMEQMSRLAAIWEENEAPQASQSLAPARHLTTLWNKANIRRISLSSLDL